MLRIATLVCLCSIGISSMLLGCASTGIALKEQFGYAKREQLVDRVKDARDGQETAKKQFNSALEEFLSVTGTTDKNADLEARYDKLKKAHEKSQARADDVNSRIASVERVADLLFKEWNSELSQYQSEALRDASKRQLADTRAKYDKLLGIMKAAAAKMPPVLAAFNDQVLFLKHNLNARAIASLQDTSAQIQNDVRQLVSDMENSINEADEFIKGMQQEPADPGAMLAPSSGGTDFQPLLSRAG